MEDTSLDEFLTDGEEEAGTESGSDDDEEIGGGSGSDDDEEIGGGSGSDDDAERSEELSSAASRKEPSAGSPVDTRAADPANSTSRSDPEGAACEACGEEVIRRWREEGRYLCRACKSW